MAGDERNALSCTPDRGCLMYEPVKFVFCPSVAAEDHRENVSDGIQNSNRRQEFRL
jgi:hypothetical protein